MCLIVVLLAEVFYAGSLSWNWIRRLNSQLDRLLHIHAVLFPETGWLVLLRKQRNAHNQDASNWRSCQPCSAKYDQLLLDSFQSIGCSLLWLCPIICVALLLVLMERLMFWIHNYTITSQSWFTNIDAVLQNAKMISWNKNPVNHLQFTAAHALHMIIASTKTGPVQYSILAAGNLFHFGVYCHHTVHCNAEFMIAWSSVSMPFCVLKLSNSQFHILQGLLLFRCLKLGNKFAFWICVCRLPHYTLTSRVQFRLSPI